MEKELQPLELLRYVRHDWLNRMQIIQGQLYLGNVDKVQEYIIEIIEVEKSASYFTQLKCPKMTMLLFTHNWSSSGVLVKIKGEGKPHDWSQLDIPLYEFIQSLLLLLESHSDLYETHQLHIICHKMDIYFDYSGKLHGVEQFYEQVHEILQQEHFQVEHTYLTDDEVSIHLHMRNIDT